MRLRGCALLAAAIAMAAAATAPAGAGQAQEDGQAEYATPRTAWGDPDLQGMWDTRTYTPMERPPEFGTREFMTEEEAAERERLGLRRVVSDDDDDAIAQELVQQDVARYARSDAPDDGRPGFRIAGAEYNAFWSADPTSPPVSLRTSQIVDPPDGRMPATPLPSGRRARRRGACAARPTTGRIAGSPSAASLGTACPARCWGAASSR